MLNSHSALLSKLNTAIAQLSLKAAAVDQHNTQLKSHKLFKEQLFFSETSFVSQSDKYADYASEIKENIEKLSRLFASHKDILSQSILEKIEEQISSLVNALNANTFMHNEASNHAKHIKEVKKQRYQKMTRSIVESSQVLYQSLSEHHEFERRLLDMLTNKQNELALANSANSGAISQQVLVLHQRLGRCRQAISKIERSIELQEKRN